MRTALLPPVFRRSDRLKSVEIGFRVSKLFVPLDLQIAVFVSSEVFDVDRLADYVNPD